MASALIRSSRHLQKLKFGAPPEPLESAITNQMLIRKAGELGIGSVGIRLSFAENRALFAIQKLLEATNYSVDKLDISISEYLDAYGVKKSISARGKSEYDSRARTAALRVLDRLDGDEFLIAYNRRSWLGRKGSQKRVDETIEYIAPLVSITKTGHSIVISPSRVLTDQINTHYCWLPADLYENQVDGSDISTPLFIEYLNYTYDIVRKGARDERFVMTYTMESWARKLRMESLIEARQYGRIRTKLVEAYELGKRLGYLKDYQINQPGVRVAYNDVLTLDTDMMEAMRSTVKSSKVYHKK